MSDETMLEESPEAEDLVVENELPVEEPLLLDDDLWEQLIELTNGAAAPCYQCGVCTASCPWGIVREQPLSVRKMMPVVGVLEQQSLVPTSIAAHTVVKERSIAGLRCRPA
jgi:heterodisulfide reductase subunit C